MKKVIKVLVVMCLIASMFPMTFAGKQQSDLVKSVLIKDLTRDSQSLKNEGIDGQKNVEKKVKVVTQMDGDKINITGYVPSLKKEFNITGEPRSIAGNGTVIPFEAHESTGNFEVVYIAYEKNAQDSALYHNVSKNKIKAETVLKAYIKDLSNNHMLMVEVFNPSVLDESNLFSRLDTFEENTNLQFWYAKMFKGILEDVQEPMLRSFNATDANSGTYRYTFNHLGGNFYHNMTLSRYIQNPTVMTSQADFYTRLEVVKEWTYSYDFPNEDNNESCFQLDDVRIDITIDEGDALSAFEIDGEVHNSWDVDVSLGVDTSVGLWGPLSIDLEYTKSDNSYDLNSAVTHLANGVNGHYYREQGMILESGKKLNDAGHYFSVKWSVSKFASTPMYGQDFKVKFGYFLWNDMDYTKSSYRTFTETKKYDSK